jgi:arylsulfatase A-like enzyme
MPDAHAVKSRTNVVRDQLTLWVAAALVAALLTLAGARAARLGFSVFRWGWDSRDIPWVAPLGYLVVFAPIGILLLLFALIRPGPSFRIAAFVWVTLVLFSFLLLFPQVHGYAWLAVAIGAGLQLSRVLGKREESTIWWAQRLVVVLGVTAVTCGLVIVGGRRLSERRQLDALPATKEGAPNVLLVILDTVRWKSLSLYGFELPTTPSLEQWAKRGVVFDQAYVTAPWTLPSHASMFTGRYAGRQSGTHTSPLGKEFVTIAEVLRRRGWATGGFTANLHATRYESGLAQGFIRFEDFKVSLAEIVRSTTITQSDNVLRGALALETGGGVRRAWRAFWGASFRPHLTEISHDQKPAREVTDAFLRWQRGLDANRPYFAFLNLFDAHNPYRPPEPYYSMFRKKPKTVDRYHGGIRYMDDELGRLLSELERRGSLANTIVVVTSDHGEQFDEHGLTGHANSLYAQLLHVPLVLIAPGRVPAGQRLAQQVSLRDLPSTLLELSGTPPDTSIEGTSLAVTWSGETGVTSEVVAEVDQSPRADERRKNTDGPMKSLVDDSLHVIRDGRGKIEAYAYRVDPENLTDLASDPSRQAIFRALLEKAVSRNALPWPKPLPRGADRNKAFPD